MKTLIKRYIEKLTTSDIETFARKNDIILNDNEVEFLYNTIKSDFDKLLKLDNEKIFEKLKENVSDENYNKITSLYLKYKDMYGYLL